MYLPEWVKTRLREIRKTQNFFKNRNINTVCETLRCPNRAYCYKEPTATFMILGDICTRDCTFCNSKKGIPLPPDYSEPKRIARVVREFGLKYTVITSPTRDDLIDGGAEHFAKTVTEIRELSPTVLIEVLVPDFRGNENSIRRVIDSGIDVFAHNIETVERLYGSVRKADYSRSLDVLKIAKKFNSNIITKSGFMLGLGERKDEIFQTLEDLLATDCDVVTIGQYLQPSKKAQPVVEYINPKIFEEIADVAVQMGFKVVLSGPLVRSSTRAYETFLAVKEGKYGKL